MATFYWDLHLASQTLLSALALGIGLEDEGYFSEAHPGHGNQLRLLHYPPVPAANIENQSSTRLDAHSDWPSITLLFQDDCGGLQVMEQAIRIVLRLTYLKIENPHKAGEFMDVSPLKDSIVMNVGDLMMRWSNGSFLTSASAAND